jgi:hypothetical protein
MVYRHVPRLRPDVGGSPEGPLREQFTIEHRRKMGSNATLDFVDLHLASKQLPQRGDASFGDAARNDELKIFEIRRHVDRKAVARHPSGDPNAYGRKLRVANPHACEAGDPSGVDAVIRRRPNEDFLEIAYVSVNVAAVGFEVDDRVADNLTGTVIGNVSPASGLVHVDASIGEHIGRRKNVRAAPIAAHAKRQHVRVLDKEEQITYAAGLSIGDQRTLQRERFVVRDPSQPANFKISHLKRRT